MGYLWSLPILLGYSLPLYYWAIAYGKKHLAYVLPELRAHPGDVDKDYQIDHYLMFLRMCRNLFCVLTLISFPWVSSYWGPEYFFFFLPQWTGQNDADSIFTFKVAITKDMDHVGVLMMTAMTLAKGFVAFVFIARFQRDTRERSTRSDRESRTLWLSNIPMRDHTTLKTHELALKKIERDEHDTGHHSVEGDLAHALMENLNAKGGSVDQHGSGKTCPIDGLCCNFCNLWRCDMSCRLACRCCPCLDRRQPTAPVPINIPSASQPHRTSQRNSMVAPPQEGLMNSTARRQSRVQDVHGSGNMSKPAGTQTRVEDMIEEIIVQPIIEPYEAYIKQYRLIRYRFERVESSIGEKQKDSWRRKLLEARNEFLDEMGKQPQMLRMSGHAFVTFKDPKFREEMMKPERSWWEWRDHTEFEFGRPPFSSVTLQARDAPNPSDLLWENLHIGLWPQMVFVGLQGIFLFFLTVGVVFALAMSSQLALVQQCLDGSNELAKDWPNLCNASSWAQKMSLSGQVPTLLLLLYNSLILPFWIEAMSKQVRDYRKSDCEIHQLTLNFHTLLLSKFLTPLVSLVVVRALLDDLTDSHAPTMPGQNLTNATLETVIARLPAILGWQDDALGTTGDFYVAYTLNCAFLSNLWAYLQLGRYTYRAIFLPLCNTKSESEEVEEPLVYAWGYWYAWCLSLAANGLFMGVAVPSMLPVTAICFGLRYLVDWDLLKQEKAFDPGPARPYAPHLVHYMFCIVAFKFLLMGCGVLVISSAPAAEWTKQTPDAGRTAIRCGGILLVALSVILWVGSRWGLTQTALDEGIASDGKSCFSSIGFWLLRQFGSYTSMAPDKCVRCGTRFKSKSAASRCCSKKDLLTPLLNADGFGEPLSPDSINRNSSQHEEEEVSWDVRVNLLNQELKPVKIGRDGFDAGGKLRKHLCDLMGMEETTVLENGRPRTVFGRKSRRTDADGEELGEATRWRDNGMGRSRTLQPTYNREFSAPQHETRRASQSPALASTPGLDTSEVRSNLAIPVGRSSPDSVPNRSRTNSENSAMVSVREDNSAQAPCPRRLYDHVGVGGGDEDDNDDNAVDHLATIVPVDEASAARAVEHEVQEGWMDVGDVEHSGGMNPAA